LSFTNSNETKKNKFITWTGSLKSELGLLGNGNSLYSLERQKYVKSLERMNII
jgi:hypothetical protein